MCVFLQVERFIKNDQHITKQQYYQTQNTNEMMHTPTCWKLKKKHQEEKKLEFILCGLWMPKQISQKSFHIVERL